MRSMVAPTATELKFTLKSGFSSQLSAEASGTAFFGIATCAFDLVPIADDYDLALINVADSSLVASTRKSLDVYYPTDSERTAHASFYGVGQAFLLSVHVNNEVLASQRYRVAIVHKDTDAVVPATVLSDDGFVDFAVKFDVTPTMVVSDFDTDAMIHGTYHKDLWSDQTGKLFKVAISSQDASLYVEEDEATDPAGVPLFTAEMDEDASDEFISVFTVRLRSMDHLSAGRSMTLIARTKNGFSLSQGGLSAAVWSPIVVSTSPGSGKIGTLAGKDYYEQEANSELFSISTTGGNQSGTINVSTNQSASSVLSDLVVKNKATMAAAAGYKTTFVVTAEQFGRSFTAQRVVWRVSQMTAALSLNKSQAYTPGALAGMIQLTASNNYGVGTVSYTTDVAGFTFSGSSATNASALSPNTYTFTATATDGLGRTATSGSHSLLVVGAVVAGSSSPVKQFTIDDLQAGEALVDASDITVSGGTNPITSLESIEGTTFAGESITSELGIVANGNQAVVGDLDALKAQLEEQSSAALQHITVTYNVTDTSAGLDSKTASVRMLFRQSGFQASINGELLSDIAAGGSPFRMLTGTKAEGRISKNLSLVTAKDGTTVSGEADSDRVNRFPVTFAIEYADGSSAASVASAGIVSTSNAYQNDMIIALSIVDSSINEAMLLKITGGYQGAATETFPFFFVGGTSRETVNTTSDLINVDNIKLAVNDNPQDGQIVLTKSSPLEESRRAFFDAQLGAQSPVSNIGSLTIIDLPAGTNWDDAASIEVFLDQQTQQHGYNMDGGCTDLMIVPHSDVNNTSELRAAAQVSQLDLNFETDADLRVRIALNENYNSNAQLTNANRYYIVALSINSTPATTSYRVLKLNNLGIVQSVAIERDDSLTFPDALSIKVTDVVNNVNFADELDWKVERKLSSDTDFETVFEASSETKEQLNTRLRLLRIKATDSMTDYTVPTQYYQYRVSARAPNTIGSAYVSSGPVTGYAQWNLATKPVEISKFVRAQGSLDGKTQGFLFRNSTADHFHQLQRLMIIDPEASGYTAGQQTLLSL